MLGNESEPGTSRSPSLPTMDKTLHSLEALAVLITTSINHVDSLTSTQNVEEQPLQALTDDYIKLTTLLRNACTKLSLAMKPPASWDAAVASTAELEQKTNQFITCTSSFSPSHHGSVFTKAVRWETSSVLSALLALVRSLISLASSKESDSKEYLLRTGSAHESLEKAAATVRDMGDNLGAVRSRWAENQSALDDALSELGGIISGEDEDEGWDELDLDFEGGKTGELTEVEKTRCEKVQRLLRLTNLLHARILSHRLRREVVAAWPASRFDEILESSSNILSTVDDLVSALHPSHDLEVISEATDEFITSLEALTRIYSVAEEQSESAPSASAIKNAKWFQVCTEQINREKEAVKVISRNTDG
ncbi:hypothetical protein SISSUDRAFT_1064442 [Sistotremastrum suecicum HHB10207 ss-3]|uniref:Cyclin-D1-binding protein 1-like N-terminal domain-containing protein n=1 Tax=Sistotremastrum suecicum HHB10207 ss-3 TaxID=1314776 RepID=A0A166ALU0_9AGAM|nr:hypothetical protein SISSUDRAFT_1064442 [Sistotremastrum suecicum HHB10207 ss-3]